MKIRRVSWLLLCLVLINLGCEGKEGPAGPQGPPGSANVIYSDWLTPDAWVLGTLFGVHERTYTITVPLLTQEIIDRGVVMVYMKFVGLSPAINQLPVILADVNLGFLFRAEAGAIDVVYYSTTSPTTDPPTIDTNNLVRYVLIPGGVLAAAAASEGLTSEELAGSLGSRPYSEVCRMFDLSE